MHSIIESWCCCPTYNYSFLPPLHTPPFFLPSSSILCPSICSLESLAFFWRRCWFETLYGVQCNSNHTIAGRACEKTLSSVCHSLCACLNRVLQTLYWVYCRLELRLVEKCCWESWRMMTQSLQPTRNHYTEQHCQSPFTLAPLPTAPPYEAFRPIIKLGNRHQSRGWPQSFLTSRVEL